MNCAKYDSPFAVNIDISILFTVCQNSVSHVGAALFSIEAGVETGDSLLRHRQVADAIACHSA